MIKRSLFFGIALMLFSACEEDIPIVVDGEEPRLVVFSLNDPSKPFEVQVARTRVLNDSMSPLTVENPTVRLFYNNGNEIPMYNEFGTWTSRINLPESGNTYRLTVSHEGFKTVNAFASFPVPPNQFETFIKSKVQVDSQGVEYDELNVVITDNPAEDNFYEIQLYYFNDALNNYVPFAPENITDDNLGVIRTNEGTFVFNDQRRQGQTIQLAFTFDALTAVTPPRYVVELSNLSPDMYRFLKSQSLYNRYNITIDVFSFYNPVQVFSNIENGVGIFAGKSIVRDTLP